MQTITLEEYIQSEDSGIIDPDVYGSDSIPGISTVLSSQFPDFVSEDHPKFIAFMKAYYEWMESQRNVLHDSHRLKSYQDIDESIDVFTDQFFKEFLVNIPRDVVVNKATLLKNIRQFYRAKGTEKSYKLFFRMLYNSNTEFYYPRVDILKASDGKWIQNNSIRLFLIKGTPNELISKRIRGRISNSTAFVEKIFSIREKALTGYEVILNNSSITGSFSSDELIDSEDGSVIAKISPSPTKIELINSGLGYSVGETFLIENIGLGATVKIDEVDRNGSITKLSMLKYGLGYHLNQPLENISLLSSNAIEVAKINIDFTGLIKYPGYYSNEDGHLSSSKYLHDGNYYQQFSYVVYVNEAIGRYKEALKKILHPAGFKLFGGFRSQEIIDAGAKIPTQTKGGEVIRKIESQIVDAQTNIRTFVSLKQQIARNRNSYPLGPANYSVFRERFNYKPVNDYNANTEIDNPSEYFGNFGDLTAQKAITPISVFDQKELSPSKIQENLEDKTNLLPDAVVISKPEETP